MAASAMTRREIGKVARDGTKPEARRMSLAWRASRVVACVQKQVPGQSF